MIKYGSHVAFLQDGEIKFGYVAEIVQRTNWDGEKTEYVITSVTESGSARHDTTISNEEHIADLTDSWRKSDALMSLAVKANTYQWSDRQSDSILHPAVPVPPAVPEPAPAEAPADAMDTAATELKHTF